MKNMITILAIMVMVIKVSGETISPTFGSICGGDTLLLKYGTTLIGTSASSHSTLSYGSVTLPLTCFEKKCWPSSSSSSIYNCEMNCTTPNSHDWGLHDSTFTFTQTTAPYSSWTAPYTYVAPTITSVVPNTLNQVDTSTALTIYGNNFGKNLACWRYWQVGTTAAQSVLSVGNGYVVTSAPRYTPTGLIGYLAYAPGTGAYTTIANSIVSINYPSITGFSPALPILSRYGSTMTVFGTNMASNYSSYDNIAFGVYGENFYGTFVSSTSTSITFNYGAHVATSPSGNKYRLLVFYGGGGFFNSEDGFYFY
jgi:hypothetical protein